MATKVTMNYALVEKQGNRCIIIFDISMVEFFTKSFPAFDIIPIESVGSGTIVTNEGHISTMSINPVGTFATKDQYHMISRIPEGMTIGDAYALIANDPRPVPTKDMSDRPGYVNRHKAGLPVEEKIIVVLHKEGNIEEQRICLWKPFDPRLYTPEDTPAEGYLGTAKVMDDSHKGIGFHAWSQNDSEFVFYREFYF